MLKANELHGILSYVPTVFTSSSGLLDEDKNRENFRRLIDAGIHGIQILGSAAEFFSLNLTEHETIVRILAEEAERAHRKVFTIAGCGAQGLSDAVSRAKIAGDNEMDAALFVLPYYFPISPEGAVIFFERIAEAVPGLSLVHYNSAMTKVRLTGKDYAAMRHIDQFIATKQGGRTGHEWRDLKAHSGHLNHFDCDDNFLYSFMNGATAVDLLISAMRPKLAMKLYKACAAGDWKAALPLQQYVWDIMNAVNYGFVESLGYSDCTGDKALVEASGFLHGGPVRAPYVPMSLEHMTELKGEMEKYPDVE